MECMKRVLWRGRSTKIKLWHVDKIGIDEGYFECRHEQIDADLEYIKSWGKSRDEAKKAELAWKQKSKDIEKKYFGPKWIKA